MGEIVAVAVVAHQPMVMVPAEVRVELGGTGADTTLIQPGYRALREAFAALEVDTFVICDTHWFTTTEHVIAGAARFSGLYPARDAAEHLRPPVRLPRVAGAREGLARGRQGAFALHGQRHHRVAPPALRHPQPRAPPAARREGRLLRRRPDRVDGLLPGPRRRAGRGGLASAEAASPFSAAAA